MGTAAVITPIVKFKGDGYEVAVGDGQPGKITLAIREHVLDIQYGRPGYSGLAAPSAIVRQRFGFNCLTVISCASCATCTWRHLHCEPNPSPTTNFIRPVRRIDFASCVNRWGGLGNS